MGYENDKDTIKFMKIQFDNIFDENGNTKN